MKWRIVTPPEGRVLTWAQLRAHLRLDGPEERDYVLSLLDAATRHAENAMGTSLCPRTMAATFYAGDRPPLWLPRGPVMTIESVVDGAGRSFDASQRRLEAVGLADHLVMLRAWAAPLTVTYTAGYAAGTLPPDVLLAIQAHVGTLFAQRESVADKQLAAVPHSLADFYRLNGREVGIG